MICCSVDVGKCTGCQQETLVHIDSLVRGAGEAGFGCVGTCETAVELSLKCSMGSCKKKVTLYARKNGVYKTPRAFCTNHEIYEKP